METFGYIWGCKLSRLTDFNQFVRTNSSQSVFCFQGETNPKNVAPETKHTFCVNCLELISRRLGLGTVLEKL